MKTLKLFLEGAKNLSAKNSSAIVVVGMGRCGTTLFHDSLCRSGKKASGFFLKSFKDIKEFKPNYVYKTHDYPPTSLPTNVKVIYLFGNPMNIAVSAHNQINKWGRLHHQHLKSNAFIDNNIVLHQDSLGLASHFEEWYKQHSFSFLSVRYESLYSTHVGTLVEEYLGLRLKLLPMIKRESDWTTHERQEDLVKVYGSLNEKIQDVDDVKIWIPV